MDPRAAGEFIVVVGVAYLGDVFGKCIDVKVRREGFVVCKGGGGTVKMKTEGSGVIDIAAVLDIVQEHPYEISLRQVKAAVALEGLMCPNSRCPKKDIVQSRPGRVGEALCLVEDGEDGVAKFPKKFVAVGRAVLDKA